MFFRLKPYNLKLGQLRKSYSIKQNHFVAGGPPIEVSDPDIIARLKAHRNDGPKETVAFEWSEEPFDAVEEEEEVADLAPPADSAPRASKPGPKAAKGKPGPKPKAARGTVPSIEAE